MRRLTLLTLATALLAVAPAAAHTKQPTLEDRALLPFDATWLAPGGPQPVGGFSALLEGPRGTYLAMPDNGFGNKANSTSFLLRVYTVRLKGGEVEIKGAINLRDPDEKIPFGIVTEGTTERYLTGGDFDIESFRIDRKGTLWFGDEFGPFLLHTDATGKVLEAPIPLPGVRSPDYPALPGGKNNLNSSNGFEGMAISPDGRTLYPTLEGAVIGDEPTVRRMYQFDIKERRYEKGYKPYRVADPTVLVSDLTALDDKRFVALEREGFEGTAAKHKRGFVVDRRALAKREVIDLLDIRDPAEISLRGARPGDIGLGDPFSMPYVTIEAVLPEDGNRLVIVNDTNFGSNGRNPTIDDDSDFIRVKVPALRG